jgi:hypothetical protein
MVKHDTMSGYVDLGKFKYLLEHYKTLTAAQMLGKDDKAKKELKMDDDA